MRPALAQLGTPGEVPNHPDRDASGRATVSHAQWGCQCLNWLACFSLLFSLVLGEFFLLRSVDASDAVDKKEKRALDLLLIHEAIFTIVFIPRIYMNGRQPCHFKSHLEFPVRLDEHPGMIKM